MNFSISSKSYRSIPFGSRGDAGELIPLGTRYPICRDRNCLGQYDASQTRGNEHQRPTRGPVLDNEQRVRPASTIHSAKLTSVAIAVGDKAVEVFRITVQPNPAKVYCPAAPHPRPRRAFAKPRFASIFDQLTLQSHSISNLRQSPDLALFILPTGTSKLQRRVESIPYA